MPNRVEDLRTISRPEQTEAELFPEKPILVVDRLVGLQIVKEGNGSKLLIAAPRSLSITFDLEDGFPIFHRSQTPESEEQTSLIGVKRIRFGLPGKRKFYVGNDYSFAYKGFTGNSTRIVIASTRPISLTEYPYSRQIEAVMQEIYQPS